MLCSCRSSASDYATKVCECTIVHHHRHTHARTPHTHTHALTHAHPNARTRAHTHIYISHLPQRTQLLLLRCNQCIFRVPLRADTCQGGTHSFEFALLCRNCARQKTGNT